jgi:hypothetical protein
MSLFLLFVLAGCDNGRSSDDAHRVIFSTVTIEFEADLSDYESGNNMVTIIDSATITEIYGIYSSMVIEFETSEPMRFPRYIVTFFIEGSASFKLLVDDNSIVSSSDPDGPRGNARLEHGNSIYQNIEDMFQDTSTSLNGEKLSNFSHASTT